MTEKEIQELLKETPDRITNIEIDYGDFREVEDYSLPCNTGTERRNKKRS